MQVAEFDHTDFSGPSMYKMNKVRFFKKPVIDKKATAEEGRPIYVDGEFIEVLTRGKKDTVVKNLARYPGLKATYGQYYRDWKANNSDSSEINGTLLVGGLFGLSESLVKTLSSWNVSTVEDLVAMPDVHVQKFMGLNGIREKAAKWVEAQKSNAGLMKISSELDQLRAQNEHLQSQLNALAEAPDEGKKPVDTSLIDDVEMPRQKRKYTRKAKVEDQE